MITAQFSLNSESQIVNISLNGHSGFGTYGNDIVCAAISGQVTMLELGLLNLSNYPILKKEGVFCVDRLDAQSQVLAQAFYLALKAIEKEYKDHVKITIKEI